MLGFDPNETDSEVSDEELRVLVNTNTNLSKDERTILDDVFDASETIVAEVMRPRADVVFFFWMAICRLRRRPHMCEKCRIPAIR